MKKRKGLTLIEIIISLAIIGIVAIVFLSIFNTGNKNISRAGKRTEEVLNLQKKIDNEIAKDEIDNKTDGDSSEVIEITIPGVITNKKISGRMISIEESDKYNIEIKTFVPNKIEGE